MNKCNLFVYLMINIQAGFRKGRGTRDQIANICWIMEKARQLHKNIFFCFIDYAKAFDCVDHNQLLLGAGALGRPRGMEWGGRREEGSGWGTHVYLWRIHFDIWQN